MEKAQFDKIQKWFSKLSEKVDNIQNTMATKQQLENRFQMLFNALTNLAKKVEDYKDQQDEEIKLLKRAIHDIEQELRQLRNSVQT